MKKSLVALGITSFFGSAFAADFTDTARVISSTPIYDRVSEPKRECWTESVQAAPKERSIGGAVVGGLAGGLLGSQVGGGNGSTVATGAGAVAGAVVGDRVANPDSNRSATGAVVGGVAGALLGSQVGGGSGNKAATAVGGIAGAVIGDRVANPDQPRTEQVQRCRDVQASREVIKGYTVVYRYNGQDVTTTLPYRPGSSIRVGVSVIDDGGRADAPSYRRSDRGDEPGYRRNERGDEPSYRRNERGDEPNYRRTDSNSSYYR
ncbi:MAG TPA: glycine zipper 2TM domain-containing protein [Gallionella sp.]|nr:glycine zipper 2TM domain-containing protein [Gallionella sp.]